MNHTFIAHREPVFKKRKGNNHIPNISAYIREEWTGKFHNTKTRGPRARIERYLKQLKRDGIRNIRIICHEKGVIEGFTLSEVIEIQWDHGEVSFL
jgi:hypothetical protein